MPIVWRDSMSVGNTLIDNDHRYLFCLVNTVELALRLQEHADVIQAAVEQLALYTRDHFAREERLQIKVMYPGYVDHKAEHQAILERVQGLQAQIAARAGTPAGDASAPPALDPAEIAALLRHWVLGHVLKSDLDLRSYLSRYPASYA